MTTRLATAEARRKFVESVDTFLLDCDGVLWGGNRVFPGIPELLAKLREMGKRVYFITNNAGSSRQQYVEKFASKGVQATKNEIFNSGYAAAVYLKSKAFRGSIYVVGADGLCTELKEALGDDCKLVVGDEGEKYSPAEFGEKYSGENFKKIKDMNFRAVVSGYDVEFNMTRLAWASMILGGVPECEFVACNTDRQIPVGGGLTLPGNGTVVQAIQTATGREPVVTGKPEPLLLDLIDKQDGLDRERTVMVGDRLETDILFGNRGGVRTLLVETGSSTVEEMEAGDIKATHVIDAFASLLS